jgi:proton translocating ATP synthase F1 alpha subunit
MIDNIKTIGYVNSIKDGIIDIKGLKTCQDELIFIFKDDTFMNLISIGIVMSILEDSVQVALIENIDKVNEGYLVVSSFDYLTISVGDWIIGSIIDPLGRPLELNEEKKIQELYKFQIETKAPGIIERTSVHEPLITGIKAVDSLIPIGLGQRELIIGDRKTGKTSLAIDFILAQRERNMIAIMEEEKIYSIYCAIGQKQNTILNIVKLLIKEQVLEDCIIVAATSADSAMLNILAPYSAMAIAEYFRDTGRHSLIILDDLSKHANAYRQISLLLRRPPGREAYPGDIFYLHSRLLERSAKLSELNGGGSITCIPIVETQDGDVSSYIPTNIISITDGQIYLDSELFHKGLRPAIHPGLSVSRVGSAAQLDTMKEVAAALKLSLAQYREVSAFTSLGADIDEYTKN